MADGEGCKCAAHSESECGCNADWTPQELIDARAEIERLRLTDKERFAIAWCLEMAATTATECDEELTALRGLLERTGSAARWNGVPVAWAAVGKNGVPMWLAYHRQDAEGAAVGLADVVPLYRSPALTDAEREAIWTVAEAYAENGGDPESERIATIMQGLWQRTR